MITITTPDLISLSHYTFRARMLLPSASTGDADRNETGNVGVMGGTFAPGDHFDSSGMRPRIASKHDHNIDQHRFE